MSVISNLTASHTAVNFAETKLKFDSINGVSLKIPRPCQNGAFRVSELSLGQSSRAAKYPSVRMALVDERLACGRDVAEPSGVLAHELVQGALVKWSSMMDKSIPAPPTAVLLHGILGSRKNWGTFARRLAQAFPTWQFLLVDLRCHGDSASMKKRRPHTVASTALDVLKLDVDTRRTIDMGKQFNGLYYLTPTQNPRLVNHITRSSDIWHQRLGHPSVASLHHLS